MNIESIYQPVKKEMLLVEEALKTTIKADFVGLSRMLEHILTNSGKRIRPTIALLSGKVYSCSLEQLIPMAAGVELLHTATLAHDDTLDSSMVRRGIPTVNALWGTNNAILAGDYLFAKSAEVVSQTGNIRAMCLFAQTVARICTGEFGQAVSAYKARLTRGAYFKRIGNKTASLFAAAAEGAGILGQTSERSIRALRNYGHNLGTAFQIVDDILNFVGKEQEMGKPVGSDLRQGTLTLPAILLIERYPEENPIREGFKHRDQQENIDRAVAMILNSSVIQDSYGIAAAFCSQARRVIEGLPESRYRKSLSDLGEYVLQRKK